MRGFCCVLSVALFLLAAVLAFDTDHQYTTSNLGVVPNLVRAWAAIGFCLGGSCAVLGAAFFRGDDGNSPKAS